MSEQYEHFQQFVRQLGRYRPNRAVGIKRTFRTETLTYGELQKGIYQAAHWLQEKGLRKGDRLLVAAPNMPEWCEVFLASQLIGVMVVPVDIRSSQAMVKRLLRQTKPHFVIRSQHFMSWLDEDYATFLLEELHEAITSLPSAAPDISLGGDEAAVIMFTSGTTGTPKGVVLTQRNILANLHDLTTAIHVQSSWRFLSILPFSHMYEITVGFLTPLSAGASIYYVARLAPLSIARSLRQHDITCMVAVPQLLVLFKKSIEQRAKKQGQYALLTTLFKLARFLPMGARRLLFAKVHAQLGRLEFIATGGAPVATEVAEFWELLGVKVLQGYGLTETAPVLTINTPDERNIHSQGRALPGVNIRLSAEHEILAQGPNVFHSYWQDKQKTTEAFTDDGWFKTGDIADRDDDGWYYIRGRSKFMIVLPTGMKVMPEDVEPTANQSPALGETVIVGVERSSGEEVYAVVQSEASDKEVDAAIDAVNTQLEAHQHISGWLRWEAEDFPRSRLLKIDRRKVWDWANKHITGQHSRPDELVDKPTDKIQAVIAMVLEKPNVKITDDKKLADLGLDSLKRLTVVSLIEEQLSVSIAEHKINAQTTVKDLRKLAESGEVIEEKIPRSRWPYWAPVRAVGSVLREAVFLLSRLVASVQVEGRENLDKTTLPAIFIFNHGDTMDVPSLYRALPLHIRNQLVPAAASDIMTKRPILSFSLKLGFGMFHFARKEPFMPSLENMATLLDNGWSVAIAPEGKMSKTGELLDFKSGTGMMAVEMQVPVVPVKLKNIHGIFPENRLWPQRYGHVQVVIGEPIMFDKHTSYDAATKQLYEVMKRL